MVGVHPTPHHPVLIREAHESRQRGLEAIVLGQQRRLVTRIKEWRWWRPIFIVMVSIVTVLDQLVASYLVVNYMWSGLALPPLLRTR